MNNNLDKIEIALSELLGDVDEWRAAHTRSVFASVADGHSLVIKETDTGAVLVSQRLGPRASADLTEVGAWMLGFKGNGRLGAIADRACRPATAAGAAQVADLLWTYRRHVIEDAVSVRHFER